MAIIKTIYFGLGLYIYMNQLHMPSDVSEKKCIPKKQKGYETVL